MGPRGARARTLRRAARRGAAPAPVRDKARLVFDDYLRAVEELRDWGLRQILADSRVLWIPLQLALRPEQHDTQQEPSTPSCPARRARPSSAATRSSTGTGSSGS